MLISLCFADFVMLRLVSIVLWRFRCVVQYWETVQSGSNMALQQGHVCCNNMRVSKKMI